MSDAAVRRGPADPVRALMDRHRYLCERAVDPLEIAAGLEAHGMTDRTAVRFRHRDVFSLAEELYARVPRGADSAAPGHPTAGRPTAGHPTAGRPAPGRPAAGRPAPGHPARVADARAGWTGRTAWAGRPGRAGWAALGLLPGALCSLTLLGLDHSGGQRRLAIGLAGGLALSGALSACLRRGPLRAGDRGPGAEDRTAPASGLPVRWLLAYLVCGDGLLDQLVAGGPHGPWSVTTAPLAALAFAVAPAAWCAHLFSVQARRRLDDSHGLADFAAGARPLLCSAAGLYTFVLTGLSLLAAAVFGDAGDGALAPTVTLGTLFFLARLLTVHGFPGPGATGLALAAAVEALACASVLAGRIPGCAALALPARAVVRAWGAGAVPTLACGAAALGLLIHAAVVLSRASAHT
ncbi:hypothetical protein [Streptomyces sp. NPDC051569]|uniref:hypothetical protein n=1 Tax=Streptomyces sp. NPDC051569 TaxID=3365661 RepID=UPI0037B98200